MQYKMLQGTIANINNNYVILNDKRFIEQTEIVNKLGLTL